ncbi:hypothetical protein LWI28_028413 [Acer negundo]|uniref:At2g29880-like C-terminal domain-containing protein n=1 Tax=Acer negundo TaxID=4023 RepID=A0AAD5NKT2_ACENE|nr:hypothetical protein LWI28_028413 [Acer negundo]
MRQSFPLLMIHVGADMISPCGGAYPYLRTVKYSFALVYVKNAMLRVLLYGDGTDARTFGVEENRDSGLDDLIYDLGTETFVIDQQEPLYRSLSPRKSTSPLHSQPMSSEVPLATRKQNRTEYEGKSSSFETNNTQPEAIDKLIHTIDKLNYTIDSISTRKHSSWDLIKKILNLDNCARFKALKLLNTRAKKIEFSKMTHEERSEWIFYELIE